MLKETVFIIGAGAIGKVLAVFLKLQGTDVVLLRGTIDDGTRSVEKIQVELPDQSIVDAEIETTTLAQFSRLGGLILFTNKSFGNGDLAKKMYRKAGDSPIVIMQNGLYVEQPFIDEGFRSIYRCVLFATSQPVSANQFRFKPVATSPIGLIRGCAEDLKTIVQTINSRYFPFRDEPAIEHFVWSKTIVNCVFNSVCPLLETDNGIFHRNEKALSVAKSIIGECTAIAKAMGIFLQEEEVVETLLRISESSEGQLISTYQDIVNNRRTEIETLNFAIVNAANQLGLGNDVKETSLLGDLILLKSELGREVG